jgi:hypothetical protein
LAQTVGLTHAQIEQIERAIDSESLPLTPYAAPSAFATLLTDILGRLRQQGFNHPDIAYRTTPIAGGDPVFRPGILSAWKNGKAQPTLESVRGLIRALGRCKGKDGRSLVSQSELESVVSHAGFTAFDIAATTHDIIARIDTATRIKPLLSALRNATDLNVTMAAIDELVANPDNNVAMTSIVPRLKHWENEASPTYPTSDEVQTLLSYYNALLRHNGHVELAASEMDAVVVVAVRDRDQGQRQGFRNRALEHRSTTGRRVISPGFDDGPHR